MKAFITLAITFIAFNTSAATCGDNKLDVISEMAIACGENLTKMEFTENFGSFSLGQKTLEGEELVLVDLNNDELGISLFAIGQCDTRTDQAVLLSVSINGAAGRMGQFGQIIDPSNCKPIEE